MAKITITFEIDEIELEAALEAFENFFEGSDPSIDGLMDAVHTAWADIEAEKT